MEDKELAEQLKKFYLENAYGIFVSLKVMFWWPHLNPKVRLAGLIFVQSVVVTFILGTIARMYEELYVSSSCDFAALAEMILQLDVGFCIVVTHSTGFIFHQRMRKVLFINYLQWFEEEDSNEKETILQTVRTSHRLGLIAFCMTFVFYMAFAYAPIFLEYGLYGNKRALIYCYFFLNEDENFGLIFFFETIVMVIITTITSSLFFSYVFYSWVMILRFQHTANRINKIIEDSMNSLENSIIKAIRIHKKSIELFEISEHFCRPILFSLMLCILVAFTSLGFMLVIQVKKGLLLNAMQMFEGFSATVIILFIVCVPSQMIIDSSDKIRAACYSSGWYLWKPKIRLFFLVIMLRTGRPCGWIAGPGIILNYEAVAFVVKTGMSYVMTMISVYSS